MAYINLGVFNHKLAVYILKHPICAKLTLHLDSVISHTLFDFVLQSVFILLYYIFGLSLAGDNNA